uniref:Rab-GAP TBC domain-containing protein n=1 Tax=Oryctolagus cuniculus TaxID=9986 RepID=A0A5F9DIY9_RABIT
MSRYRPGSCHGGRALGPRPCPWQQRTGLPRAMEGLGPSRSPQPMYPRLLTWVPFWLQGRRGGVLVMPWEEEDEATRPFPDQLGILHEKRLPRDSAWITKNRQNRSLQKWLKILKNWQNYQNTQKKLKAQGRLRSQWVQQIDVAVSKTFRGHVMFRERFGVKQQALFHLLLAYSVYDPEVGYSPGLNQVAALLLIFLDEEDAFWALAQLMANDRHAMQGRCWLDQPPAARLELLPRPAHQLPPHLGVHNNLPLESLNVGLRAPHTA